MTSTKTWDWTKSSTRSENSDGKIHLLTMLLITKTNMKRETLRVSWWKSRYQIAALIRLMWVLILLCYVARSCGKTKLTGWCNFQQFSSLRATAGAKTGRIALWISELSFLCFFAWKILFHFTKFLLLWNYSGKRLVAAGNSFTSPSQSSVHDLQNLSTG